MINFDKTVVDEKRKVLVSVAEQLKTEFFGIDKIIDKVINSIQSWYIFPELVTRPVIINLWGMTGVGKTQLVRRLVALLKFQDRFVEVQMDGGSLSSNYYETTLTKLLSSSLIEEGERGILLLDEFQRFRTVEDDGSDVKLERFQDVWTLLSDGKFSSDASVFNEIEMMLAYNEFSKDSEEKVTKDKKSKIKPKLYKISPYEARDFKKILKSNESITEIMQWEHSKVLETLADLRINRVTWEVDYSKLLIFISGNLDEAFTEAFTTDDCDTDADFYYELTKKISVTDIKKNLKKRFRPEQISRFGNNHIIYPSISKESYMKLIDHTCNKYITEMQNITGITFILCDRVKTEIYNNSVYPTQGTRPVFSSVHMIFSNVLVDIAFWCLENNVYTANLDINNNFIIVNNDKSFPVTLDLNEKRKKSSLDFKTYVAVHEAGHALINALLTKTAPFEVKINTVSYTGGYMLPNDKNVITTKMVLKNKICIYLAGTAAEEIVFGIDNRSAESSFDIMRATEFASRYFREYGMGQTLSLINGVSPDCIWNTDIKPTNKDIENLLKEQYKLAKTLLKQYYDIFKAIVDKLLENTMITQDEFIDLLKDKIILSKENVDSGFNKIWLDKK